MRRVKRIIELDISERYVITVSQSHEYVQLIDTHTNEWHIYDDVKPLYDALGQLANWRERDKGE